MNRAFVAALMIAGALVAGCNKEEPAKQEPKAEAQSALPATCDEYFKKADECFSKNAQLKAQMETSIKQVKEMLTARAANPGEKEKIASECQEKINLLAMSCK
ncbi:MAG TPA: hypothetical protein VLS89_09270 [Candidatus Nanopelagicales bacterium]|nr:hypothetical protein [Candidatus Nanopelagicales bacterium]